MNAWTQCSRGKPNQFLTSPYKLEVKITSSLINNITSIFQQIWFIITKLNNKYHKQYKEQNL